MPTKAQISAGAASVTIGRRPKARAPGKDSSDYERARVDEIRSRASLYRLRLETLESELLAYRRLAIIIAALLGANAMAFLGFLRETLYRDRRSLGAESEVRDRSQENLCPRAVSK
jgi:hypothetical protein